MILAGRKIAVVCLVVARSATVGGRDRDSLVLVGHHIFSQELYR